jgi:hypothetical protein
MKPLIVTALWLLPSYSQAASVHHLMDEALGRYLAAQRDLAADRAGVLAGHFAALDHALAKMEQTIAKGAKPGGEKLRAQVVEARRVLREKAADFASGDLERTRQHFFALSKPLIRYVGTFRAREGRYQTFYCSMKKAAWIQTENTPANPYYGAKMLQCGDRVRTRDEPGQAPAPKAACPGAGERHRDRFLVPRRHAQATTQIPNLLV